MFAPLLLLLALPGAEPNDAERLFLQMEEKVMKAKSVECAGEMKAETEDGGIILIRPRPYTLCAEGNKGRMEYSIDSGDKTHKIVLIGDGAKMATTLDGKSEDPKHDPKFFSDVLRSQITRGSVSVSYFLPHNLSVEQPNEFKIDKEFKVSDFKLGKKEMVGKQEAQVVEYKTVPKQQPETSFMVTVWLDTKTQLPLKRVAVHVNIEGNRKTTYTATDTFTKLELDGKIDTKQFELPKK
jgi:hypothetical protein